ncbi:hypothetical protein CDLVIII_1360 [Clostridium sp. DL-VIII]|uniref:hypothetical protein n=1 Tax=Clostridium sp. DL-VIII TaxID=641107 RepID=UPI00023AF84F|nr:hypothetical protein [Clostridium sp. DL-VIII]EHI98059.1 hypothetical protein CDLVIII_1360 [Clostridium sp. DL-VIII]
MKELLISQIAPIATTAITAILVVIIKTIGSAAVEVLSKKKEQIDQAIKASGHEQDLQTAKEVWNIVEEKFRITKNASKLFKSKADEFNKLLLQRIPGLSEQNLYDLRQAIAGEVNAYKSTLLTGEAINTGIITVSDRESLAKVSDDKSVDEATQNTLQASTDIQNDVAQDSISSNGADIKNAIVINSTITPKANTADDATTNA